MWFVPFYGQSDQSAVTLITNILNSNSAFQTLMKGNTFGLYEVLLELPANMLQQLFAGLNANSTSLAVQAMALVAMQGQVGYGVEGFSENPGDLTNFLTILKNNGGNLNFIAWDEPLCFGVYETGRYTVAQCAEQVAMAGQEAKALFPACLIGDIEPVVPGDPPAIEAWLTSYATAAGKPFDFFIQDVQHWDAGWETAVAQVNTAVRASGAKSGIIIDGYYNDTSDDEWCAHALALAQTLYANPLLTPDFAVVQSWQNNPSEIPDPNRSGTLASVAAAIAKL